MSVSMQEAMIRVKDIFSAADGMTPTYSFNDGYTQPAMDRSITNGFRCYRELPGDTAVSLTKPIAMAYRDYHKEKPLDDKTFEIFLHQYRYDKTPLNAKTDSDCSG